MMSERLNEWIDLLREWNDVLRAIPQQIDTKLMECQAITDEEQAQKAWVELLFMRNRLEHMIKIWSGESEEE